MQTYSGKDVRPSTADVPTVEDIALGLGRIPRFAGQSTRFWPVLLHSLIAKSLAEVATDNKRVHFLALIHDAHEAVTSDVPTTWKPQGLKIAQAQLDVRFYKTWGVVPPAPWEKELIRDIDLMCLACEAEVVGPPGWEPRVVTLPKPSMYGVALTYATTCLYPDAASTDGHGSLGVGFFVQEFNRLLTAARLVL